jgi:UrcA family protein
MNGILIAASAAALSISAMANVDSIRFEGDTAHIQYRDLDLASHKGRTQLIGRVRKAAERICANYDGSVLSFEQINQCNRVLVASGLQQIEKIPSSRPMTEPRAMTAMAQAQMPDTGCSLPSEPRGVPAALDAAITGPADMDRACMKALLIPDARITLVSVGADGTTSYKLLTLDDWIARTKARGHGILEEKQLNFRIDRFGNIAHLWSLYALRSDGHAAARGINSIQAIKETGGWRIAAITVQAESAAAPLPEKSLP